MKFIRPIFLALTYFLAITVSIAGDLGGGGTSKLVLTKEQKQALIKQGSPEAAFDLWVQSLDKPSQTEVYRKVFISNILPQLSNQ